MENNEEKKIILKTISIKDLWNVLRGCWMFMLALAIIVSVAGYLYGKSNYVPMYSSSATLYLLGTNEGGEVGEDDKGQWTVNYTLANVVIDDSIYLLTSRTVLNQLGDELGVANGYGAFKGGITIANPEGTRVLEVRAVASSPELAKQIVDGVCRIGSESINDVLDYNQMHVFEAGSYNPYPYNGISFSTYGLYGVIAAVVTYVVFLALFLFDTYIHTEEDIDRYLGVSVLGDIPDAEEGKKKGKYAYGKNISKKKKTEAKK